jgi:hypothetical protein
MGITLYFFRATYRRSLRVAVVVALIGGLLGAAAMAALAGARRSDSAYGRYLQAAKASDVMIDVPGALLPVVRQIERLPGTLSAAAWLGLNAAPVIHGKVDPSFVTDALTGSLDGEYFRQDKMTVLAGKVPALDATNEMAITRPMAQVFGLHPGDHMTWQFYRAALVDGVAAGAISPAQHTTFLITGIVATPPALDDQMDQVAMGIVPPAATARALHGEWAFGWVAMRLRGGDTGIPALRRRLAVMAAHLSREYYGYPVNFDIRILAIAQHEAQQGIEPEAVALAALGGLIALALLVLVGQGLAQLISRSAGDATILRAMGATRAETALSLAAPGGLAIAASAVLSVAGAIALSPLAPVGPVRIYDPQTGVRIDWVVLGFGALAMLLLLGGVLAWLSWRTAGQPGDLAMVRPLAVMTGWQRSGLPVTALIGMRYALERGYGRQRAPVRATLAGSVIAVTALAVSLVFSASLTGLVSHPARYGWNWNALAVAQGGWAALSPKITTTAMAHQPGVTGWSEFGFGQLTVDHQEVPVLGLLRQRGSVQPPTTSGHALAGADQIELGTVTMRQLHVHVGDTVLVGPASKPFTVVGVVTLPSFGTVLTDHPSLGRGAMMEEAEMLAIQHFPAYSEAAFNGGAIGINAGAPSYPSTLVLDATSSRAASNAMAKLLAADPDEDPGGMYTLPPEQGAQVLDLQQMGGLPLSISLGVALAAVLALGLTIAASVRQRRRELALLKSLGMQRRQLRVVVACQTSTILLVAVIVGIPLGIAAGRWAWTAFASEIGVVPAPVVPAVALALGALALLAVGNLLASWPADVAARTPVARVLRSE